MTKRTGILAAIVLLLSLVLLIGVAQASVCGLDLCIDIEKFTNGVDADSPPGPTIPAGDPVTWTYVVTNGGDLALQNLTVTDDQLGLICTVSFLAAGDSFTCTASGVAVAGQYANIGTVVAEEFGDPAQTVTDSDPSHYFGQQPGEGCTPGFWKNHLADWGPTGFSPGDDFDATFGVGLFNPDITLEQAVNLGGGGVNKLARHGTAALLSAAHPEVNYPLTVDQVIAAVQSGDADTLAGFNELGCSIP